MNIPQFITEKGPYYLHKKYGLSKSSLNLWQNKGEEWSPSPLISLAFERIKQIENKKAKKSK